MTSIYLIEPDAPGSAWAPFAGAAPLCELRAGMWRLRQRWERALGGRTMGVVAAHAAGHRMPSALPVITADAITGPAWVVDALFCPKLPMRAAGTTRRLLHGGRTVAWRLDAGQKWAGPFNDGDGVVIEGKMLAGAFDLLTALEQFLFADTVAALDATAGQVPEGTIVLGNVDAIALRGAEIEPGVVLDARKGAIVLDPGVQVRSGTRIEGPFWAGRGTLILGGQLRQVAAGPQCRLHGEISNSVFMGFANKSHDGFLGHSVVGEWVNVGAGTITSNLKNTYGAIRLDIGSDRIETKRTNVGTLFGDHVKTAIGTLLPTGAVIGAGANLFGSPRAPKYVAPFAWGGESDERIGVEQFVTVAERILPRRDVAVDDGVKGSLRALHARLTRS